MLGEKFVKSTYSDFFRKWGFTKIKLNVLFAEVEFEPTDDDQTAAWELYIELLTRITTQPLAEVDGDEKTALDSIHSLFPITREILRNKGRSAENFTKISIIVLNQVVRPFTSKWHRKELKGAFNDIEECKRFRNELKLLQKDLLNYARMLSEIAMVEDLTEITE